MRAHLTYLRNQLRESFWFVPALMIVAAICLSLLTTATDRAADPAWLRRLPWVSGLGLDNARLIASTIAGSMITVASLAFSLTLVALTLASQQLGPRLLSLFMRDRMTQVVLGTFVGTFVYALLILASLDGGAERRFVATASVGMALLLAVASFGVLIVFIHHLSRSLQADIVVARIAAELQDQVERVFGHSGDDAPDGAETVEDRASPTSVDASAAACPIPAPAGGYVQAIDRVLLVEAARKHRAQIELLCRAGQFLSRGETCARTHGAGARAAELAQAVHRAVVLGPKRTQAQDPEFALQTIVEIALRALSPGINDPYTAVTCVDRLSEALAVAFRGRLPPSVYCDDDGAARVYARALTMDGMVDTAFNELRQAARGNVAVLARLAEGLVRLAQAARSPAQARVLRRHAQMVAQACARHVEEASDRADVYSRLRALHATFP